MLVFPLDSKIKFILEFYVRELGCSKKRDKKKQQKNVFLALWNDRFGR